MTSLGPWLGGPASVFDPFNMDVWDPFPSGWGRVWDTSRGRQRDPDDPAAMAHTCVDWRETEDAHIFQAEIPGVRKAELKVQVEDNNILQISGEKVKEEEEAGDTWHRVERRRGSFVRRFRLPDNANLDAISCSLDHGVLTARVPKKEKSALPERNVRCIDIS